MIGVLDTNTYGVWTSWSGITELSVGGTYRRSGATRRKGSVASDTLAQYTMKTGSSSLRYMRSEKTFLVRYFKDFVVLFTRPASSGQHFLPAVPSDLRQFRTERDRLHEVF